MCLDNERNLGETYGFTGEQEGVIQPAAECAAEERCYHWDPEVIATCAPHAMTISDHVAHQSWAEVSSKVDSIASFPAEACSNTENDEEQSKGCERTSSKISIIFQGIDEEHQECGGDEL